MERRSASRWRDCASAWRRISCASASASGVSDTSERKPRVVGLGREERALLVGDRELRAQPLQAVAHVDEAAFAAEGLRHGHVHAGVAA